MTSSLTFDFSLNKSLKTLCQKSQKLDHHLHMNSTNSDAVFFNVARDFISGETPETPPWTASCVVY